MKKIIDGKLYDTDKARLLGTWISSGDGGSECTEALYRKRTGEYFLHGVGGTATRYAVSLGQNDWEPGSMIIPLPAAKAREWAREKLSADKYDAIFRVPDGTEKETLCLQLPADLIARLRAGASEEGTSLKAYVEAILRRNI